MNKGGPPLPLSFYTFDVKSSSRYAEMEDLRIAAVCMRSDIGDVNGNLESMLGRIDALSRSGADMVLFPEMCLTGYSMSSETRRLSFSSPEVRAVAESTESGPCVCFGFADEDRRIVQAVAEDGRIVGAYRKTHLGAMEAERMVPGDSLDVIRTSKAVVGIQMCWESHFPEITCSYALQGADLVLMPHASGLAGARRSDVWNRILPARAYDNSVFVACCNACGPNGAGTSFGGGAMILDPKGKVLAEDASGGECEMMADLESEKLRTIREGDGYRTMKDVHYLSKRRPELYRRF